MSLYILQKTESQYVSKLGSIFLDLNTPFKLERNCDLIELKAIKIPSNYKLSNLFLQILCNDQIIFEINLKLLNLLQSSKDKEILFFPPNLIFRTEGNAIPIIGIQFFDIIINIKSTILLDNFSNKIELFVINKNFETNLRKIHTYDFEKLVHYFQTIKFKTNKLEFKSSPFLLGFFIKTTLIKNINLQVDNHEIFDYNNEQIELVGEIINKQVKWSKEHSNAISQLPLPNELINIIEQKCVTLNKYLYWIPISACEKWDSNNVNSYCKGNCEIIFDKKYSGSIYLLNFNYFIGSRGMCALRYHV